MDLAQVLSTRNRLAHRFFREHELNFASFTGREQMLAELMQAADEFERMDQRLRPVISRFLRARGLSDQEQKCMIDDELTRLESWLATRRRVGLAAGLSRLSSPESCGLSRHTL